MLNASAVTKAFGSVKAVEDLSLSVGAGELFCLLGANGAGKTTTINLFLGFLSPDAGRVAVGEIEPSVSPQEARRQLAYIPENVALYSHLSGLENLSLFLAFVNLKKLVRDHLGQSTACLDFDIYFD